MASKVDLADFEKLYKEHFELLCLSAFQILKDRDVAQDIVQDFFISYWKKRDTVVFNFSFKAYAIKAVKNLSLKHIEKLRIEDAKKTKLPLELDSETITFEVLEVDKHKRLKELIDLIPESRRQILLSHIVDGLSYAQIAEMNDISINTVKTQMKRSYSLLRASKDVLYFFSGLVVSLFSS